jgi:hypothetical protein
VHATIQIDGATRSAAHGPGATYWQVSFTVRTDSQFTHTSLAGVYQLHGPQDFANVSIATPDNLPDWICEASLRTTLSTYFANQAAQEIRRLDGSLSESLRLLARIKDDYDADAMPWTYIGTQLLPAGTST